MRAVAMFLLLGACATLPPVAGTISPEAQAQRFPELVPLSPLLRTATVPSRAAAAQDALQARGARARAAAIPAPATGDLAERARRLRERAAALRATVI